MIKSGNKPLSSSPINKVDPWMQPVLGINYMTVVNRIFSLKTSVVDWKVHSWWFPDN